MMKRMALTTLAALLLGGTPLVAQQEIKLYPNGPKESNELNRPENKANRDDGWVSDISDARMYAYFAPQDKSNGAAVVICPGGGYAGLAATKEGSEYAQWLNERGVSAFVLYYRMPNGHCTVPLTDVQNAFRYCRAKAPQWGVTQIGVMGFSAGGHLAASASTLFADGITRPDFSVLVYPVITFEEFVTHAGTRLNLVGPDAGRDMVERYSLENRVSPSTPPTILLLSGDDRAVPPENSLRYYRAMQENGVPGELHIFTSGGHGWGFTTMENSGGDKLGDQRQNFFQILGRWLDSQRQ